GRLRRRALPIYDPADAETAHQRVRVDELRRLDVREITGHARYDELRDLLLEGEACERLLDPHLRIRRVRRCGGRWRGRRGCAAGHGDGQEEGAAIRHCVLTFVRWRPWPIGYCGGNVIGGRPELPRRSSCARALEGCGPSLPPQSCMKPCNPGSWLRMHGLPNDATMTGLRVLIAFSA